MGGLYDLACALLTLARRQPHHRVERWTLAGRWPIPKDVRRGRRRRMNRCCEERERERDERGAVINTTFRRSGARSRSHKYSESFSANRRFPHRGRLRHHRDYVKRAGPPAGEEARIRPKQTALAPQSWQLRSIRPFEARSRAKLGDRGRDVRPRMDGHQTAQADIHLKPAAGFEELMELLSLISACVGGLSSPFYLPSVRLQRSKTHICWIV